MKIASVMNEADLIRACLNKERRAQELLYKRYYGKMVGVCYRYAGYRDEAGDILNKGFLKVFNSLNKYDPRQGTLDSWIYRIIVNTAIDHYRKHVKNKHTEDIDTLQGAEADAEIISRISASEIIECIAELSPAYRLVFNLYVLDGYSHKEIAKELNIAEGTSKSNLAKARARLQQILTNRNGDTPARYAGEI